MTISVIIPLFNHAPSIGRALESVLRQTRGPEEIVVVDDGSSDGGADIVARVGNARIHLIRQPNAGVSAARNRGIECASGNLIAFLDADDQWLPEHLQTIASLAQSHPRSGVFGTSYVIRTGQGSDRRPLGRAKSALPNNGILGDYFAIAAVADPPFCSSSVAVTRSAIRSVGGFPIGIAQGEDLLTWARLASRFDIAYSSRPSAVIWQPLFNPRPTRKPETEDRVGPALADLLHGVAPPVRGSLRRYLALWHKMRGSMYLKLGDRTHARREFTCAMRYHGFSPRLMVKYSMCLLPTGLAQQLLIVWMRFTRRAVGA